MTRHFTSTLTKIACTAALGAVLAGWATSSQAYTSEQRIACTPDAFRLCSSEIPNIDGVTACMRKNRSSLSSACRAVFGK